MGAPASFDPFTPGMQKDYFASTTANVISTAADATLSVADPSSNHTGHLVNGSFFLPERLQANAVRGTTSAGIYAPVGGSANPTHAADLGGARVERPPDGRLQAAGQGQRRVAHGHVQQDADVHPVDNEPVGTCLRRRGQLGRGGVSRHPQRVVSERQALRSAVGGERDQRVLRSVEVPARTCPRP